MKTWIQFVGSVALVLISVSVGAQTQSVVNNYGPPTYTGGTIASPNETFAIYHTTEAAVKEVQTVAIRQVYPNPANSVARIILESVPRRPTTISVFNTNGVLERSFQLSPGASRYDLDVSYLPNGIYSIQVQETGKEAQSVQLSKY